MKDPGSKAQHYCARDRALREWAQVPVLRDQHKSDRGGSKVEASQQAAGGDESGDGVMHEAAVADAGGGLSRGFVDLGKAQPLQFRQDRPKQEEAADRDQAIEKKGYRDGDVAVQQQPHGRGKAIEEPVRRRGKPDGETSDFDGARFRERDPWHGADAKCEAADVEETTAGCEPMSRGRAIRRERDPKGDCEDSAAARMKLVRSRRLRPIRSISRRARAVTTVLKMTSSSTEPTRASLPRPNSILASRPGAK